MLYTVTIRQGCLACEQNFHLGNILKRRAHARAISLEAATLDRSARPNGELTRRLDMA